MTEKKEIGTFSFKPAMFVFVISIALSFLNVAFAQGDLLIFPKRIVYEGRNRVEQVILSNTGENSASYNISFLEYRMKVNGEFEKITEPDSGQLFASPFLRFFPRRVTLAPGESQTIKVQVVNTDKMEEGEYRSHLYFRAEKNNNPLGKENEVKESNTISVKLEAVFGISIPVIIRKGTSNTVTSISNLEYSTDEESNPFLSFSINRKGNMSTYGDITINYISEENNTVEVGFAKGLAIYNPGNLRKVKMQLQKPGGTNFNGGSFEVVYTENESKKVITGAKLKL